VEPVVVEAVADFAKNKKVITKNNNKIYQSEPDIVHLLALDPPHTVSVLMGPVIKSLALHSNAPCA